MTEHRVDELRLHVSAAAQAVDNPSGAAQQFVASVLDAVGERLESRWRGRFVFLRDLSLHWQIGAEELFDARAIARYADQIADSVRDVELQPPGRPISNSDIIAFRDEAQYWACYLSGLSIANGPANTWVFDRLRDSGASLVTLAAQGRLLALAVLSELADAGLLYGIVEQADSASIHALNRVFAISTPPSASVPLPQHPEATEFFRRIAAMREASALPRESRLLIAFVEAARLFGSKLADDDLAAVAYAAIPDQSEEKSAAANAQELEIGVPTTDYPAKHDGDIITQFGGLFYLLSLAMELELGEILWKACLPEGMVLAHAATLICSTASPYDPAAMLFGGVSRLEELKVSAQQQREIAVALFSGVSGALPRRGLARLPQLTARVITMSGTPTLIAGMSGSPFALFIWPGAVGEGMRELLSAWPASSPRVQAEPALAEMEGGIRTKAVSSLDSADSILVPAVGSPAVSALLAQVAGTLCSLFSSRAQMQPLYALSALVSKYLSWRAKISLAPKAMVVTAPMARVELTLRKAGLDRDPGWIPWLQRSVRFEWEDDDPAS